MSAEEGADIYQAAIMDRARRPRRQGSLRDFDVEVHETNRLCGDRVTLTLKWDTEGRILALGYHARACAICLAATDFMAEIIPGLTAEQARSAGTTFEEWLRDGGAIPDDSVIAPMRPFQPLRDVPSRIGCATLAWRALVAALSDRQS